MQINWVSEGLKKSKTFWASALVEAGANQNTGSCMSPTLEMSYHKRDGSLFTSGLLHNFTLVKKVKEVRLTGWTFFTSLKILFFSFKSGYVKIKVDTILVVDKLTV